MQRRASRSTLHRSLFIALALVVLSPERPSQQAPVNAADYLNAARSVARYLDSIATVDRATGLRAWPGSNLNTRASSGMDNGAAGIGTFYLQLYEATRDASYLLVAEQASDYVFAQYRRSGPPLADWLGGAAGAGSFAARLYDLTGRSAHLANVQWVADWLVTNAKTNGDGRHWPQPNNPKVFIGRYHGPAGIGLFLLRAHELTGDARYLDTAVSGLRWMEQHIVRFSADAIGWRRLTTDRGAYHQWCGGSSGIMEFLGSLAKATGDRRYSDLYRQTAEGLAQYAVPQAEGVAWHYASSDRDGFPVVFCHGSASNAIALYQAWRDLGDSRYLQLARQAAAWTASVAFANAPGEKYWPHIFDWDQFESGYQTGTASVGHAYLLMHAADANDSYLRHAREAAAYLLRVADRPARDQLRWINYTNPERPDWPHEFQTGWYAGAAGIGSFFVEMYAAETARSGRTAR